MLLPKSSTSHIASPNTALVFFNTSPTIIIIDFSALPWKITSITTTRNVNSLARSLSHTRTLTFTHSQAHRKKMGSFLTGCQKCPELQGHFQFCGFRASVMKRLQINLGSQPSTYKFRILFANHDNPQNPILNLAMYIHHLKANQNKWGISWQINENEACENGRMPWHPRTMSVLCIWSIRHEKLADQFGRQSST